MAFNIEELSRTGSIAGGSLWVYTTSDSIDTILAANYFNNAFPSLKVGDVIQTLSNENLIEFRVTTLVNRTVAVNVASEDRGTKRKYVREASDFDSPIDSNIEYFIDGIVDMGSTSLEVPVTGINLSGYNFDVSKLISSENNYTMFTSPGGGSGNFLFKDIGFEVTGTSSQVYDLTDSDGTHAFECARINYNDCTSLGEINGYRQGLEVGTGRFGGTPEMCLSGTWAGGFFIGTSIVRSLTDGSYSLFKAGAAFSMASRFRSNQNIDLPASVSFIDFAASNFPNPSTIELDGMRVTRNGVSDASDPNITPNVGHEELPSAWVDNKGIPNTHVGGRLTVTAQVTTTINTISVPEDLLGTFTPDLLEHFDEPSNGQLRHLGNNPREYEVITEFTISGTANDQIEIRLMKFDDSASSSSEIQTQVRQINSLVGPRDVAFFNDFAVVELDQNDYIYYQVINNSGTGNLTAEDNSFFIARAR